MNCIGKGARTEAGFGVHQPAARLALRSLAAAALAALSPVSMAAGTGLAAVVITATRNEVAPMESPSSVTVVDQSTLELQRPDRLGDMLREVPNVYVRGAAMGAAFPGSGQAVLSLRGIPRSMRTLVLIDGMPINNALSGGINVASLPIDDIERVEVVRGPHSALYGGNAMGGVINFISAGPDQPLTRISAGYGSFGQRRVGFALRRRLPDGLGLSVSVARRESDGYDDSDWAVASASPGSGTAGVSGARPTLQRNGTPGWLLGYKGARPWTSTQVSIAAEHALGEGGRLRAGVSVGSYDSGYSRPQSFMHDASGAPLLAGTASVGGGMRVRFSETSFITPSPSGESDIRMFAQWTQAYGENSTFRLNASLLRHRFDFVMPSFGLAGFDTGPGSYTRQPDTRFDMDASWHFALGRQWLLTSGVAISRSELDRTEQALSSWRDQNTVTGLNGLGQGSMTGSSVYLQAEWLLSDRLSAYIGGRYDDYRTQGRVAQNSAPAFDLSYDGRSFDAFSPKLAMSWRALPGLSLRASYGEGFRPPSLLDLYSRVATPSALAGGVSINDASPDLKPERIRAFELGADGEFAPASRWSLTLYRQHLRDLIYRQSVSPTLSRTINAGEARIDGLEGSLRWQPTGQLGRWLALSAGFSHQLHYEITDNAADPTTVGKKITDVPRSTATLGAELRRGALSAWLAYHYTGSVFGSGDDLNQNTTHGVYGAYDAHGTFDARAAWRVSRSLELALSVENLSNRRYFEFYRQPGRSMMFELSADL